MGRLLVVGDVHGEYKLLEKVLKKAKYNHNQDKLILIGDYIDRGDNSQKVVNLVRKLVEDGAIALKGNHENMAYNYAKKLINNDPEQDNGIYFLNGGQKTLDCYSNIDDFIKDAKWLHRLPEKYIIENEYIFVHAGLKPGVPVSEQDSNDLLWIREEFFYYNWEQDPDINETIVAGHTPVHEIQFLSQVIMIDTGAGKGGYLSLLDLTNNKIYKAGNYF